ncbi:hypothetical protein JKP88DRAFT_169851, partial [Tribonema minus]
MTGSWGSSRRVLTKFCKQHAPPGTRSLYRSCEAPGCTTHAYYGYVSTGVKRSCARHKEDGMVFIERPRCSTDGCNRYPLYGASQIGGTHCSDHIGDIIGTPIYFDQECNVRGCKRVASWGSTAAPYVLTHCETHKLPDAVPL